MNNLVIQIIVDVPVIFARILVIPYTDGGGHIDAHAAGSEHNKLASGDTPIIGCAVVQRHDARKGRHLIGGDAGIFVVFPYGQTSQIINIVIPGIIPAVTKVERVGLVVTLAYHGKLAEGSNLRNLNRFAIFLVIEIRHILIQ